MQLSAKGLDLIKHEEGLSLKPYPDAGGWSVGYGHFIRPEEKVLMAGIDPVKAEALLVSDIAWATKAVCRYVAVPLSQNQFDALVSFIYNIGETAFRKSTMLKFLNEGKFSEASSQFARWVYSDGNIDSGLLGRRAAEKSLFQTV